MTGGRLVIKASKGPKALAIRLATAQPSTKGALPTL
jgi:hypothetical protein